MYSRNSSPGRPIDRRFAIRACLIVAAAVLVVYSDAFWFPSETPRAPASAAVEHAGTAGLEKPSYDFGVRQ